MFDYVGLFSAAIMPDKNAKSPVYDNLEEKLAVQFAKKPALYWIAIGDKDFLYKANCEYREMLDKNVISKYDWTSGECRPMTVFEGCAWNNGTKANPALQGDIIGDWREEVLMRTADNQNLRLYVTAIPTDYRFHTFMEDPVYRASVANQNIGYNQPAEPGFYFGPDLKGKKFRGTVVK